MKKLGTPQEMLEQLAKRSGGLPDFVKKALVEQGGMDAGVVEEADRKAKDILVRLDMNIPIQHMAANVIQALRSGVMAETLKSLGTDVDDLCRRLRGEYRIPIRDGLGPVGAGEEPDNPHEFVQRYQVPEINIEAADTIEALTRND